MNHLRRSLALCLTLAAAVLPGRPAARAQTVSPVPAPTIITSAPYTITTAGYYQLGANINYSGSGTADGAIISINASNVTLDLAGHYIAGPVGVPTTTLNGIYAYERSNILIQNGTVAYCYYGIKESGNGGASTNFINARVLNMSVTKCYYVGISCQFGVSPIVSGCNVSSIGSTNTNSSAYGIEVYAGSSGQITNNVVNGVAAQGTGSAYGLSGGNAFAATGNSVSNVTTGTGSAYGIYNYALAVENVINTAKIGLYSGTTASKYRANLTTNCTTAFSGGTAVGSDNN